MGIFSEKKRTYVTSVTYPLGNDGDDRPNFLKHTIINSVLQDRPVGQSLVRSYLGGPGIGLRNAYRYGRDHYALGVPYSTFQYISSLQIQTLHDILIAGAGGSIYFINVVATVADFTFWAEQHLAVEYGYDRTKGVFSNPPAGVEATAAVSYDIDETGLITILLMNANGVTTPITFTPAGFVSRALYVHSAYRTVQVLPPTSSTSSRPTETGDTAGTTATMTTVDNNGELHETTTTTTVTVADGTTTTTVEEAVRIMSRPKYFIYQLGLGTYPTLDAWLNSTTNASPYFPSIPLRLNNEGVAENTALPENFFATAKKFAKKASIDLEDIIAKVEDNESLPDIDFCFLIFGVSLNTKAPEGKRYLYQFFEHLDAQSVVTQAQIVDWEAGYDASTGSGDDTTIPEDGSATGGYASPPQNVLRIFDEENRGETYDTEIQWSYIKKTVHSGVIAVGARPGDVAIIGPASINSKILNFDYIFNNELLLAQRQIDENSYEQLEIAGLLFTNFVYQGKTVVVTAFDAFSTPEQEGFIIPLNYQLLREMSIVDATQLSYDCCHLVFNCYQIVVEKWYQSDWFKVLLIIVAIIITVLTWGADGGTSLGYALSYGAAVGLGFTGVIALWVAATFYVLAAMILMTILTKVATKLFGEEWGPVIAAIISIVAMNWGDIAAIAAGTANITASTLINLSISAINVYNSYQAGQLAKLDVPGHMEKLQTEYESRMDEIEKLTKEMLGTDADMIDIQGFTNASQIYFESAPVFLSRTLLTGSDICDITSGLITNYAEVGLLLPTNG